jgi:hypothetical protein
VARGAAHDGTLGVAPERRHKGSVVNHLVDHAKRAHIDIDPYTSVLVQKPVAQCVRAVAGSVCDEHAGTQPIKPSAQVVGKIVVGQGTDLPGRMSRAPGSAKLAYVIRRFRPMPVSEQ